MHVLAEREFEIVCLVAVAVRIRWFKPARRFLRASIHRLDHGRNRTGQPYWKANPAWIWGLRLAAITLAGAITLVKRFAMNVDGISYLDMAYAYMRGDWKIAINSYWAAGYSWLLGVFLVLFRLPMRRESTVVHLVNLLIFIGALIAFEYFVRGVVQLANKTPLQVPGWVRVDDWIWWVGGYLVFLVVNYGTDPLQCGIAYTVSPDLIHWTPLHMMLTSNVPWPPCYGFPGLAYGAIIDHNDTTTNFEHAGRSFYLYYSRFNNPYLDRDLVRAPVSITAH